MDIKIGYLVAYDYEMLKRSLPTVYRPADKIVLAIDKDRKTFAGENFTIPSSFFDWLKDVDKENKVTVIEESFFVPGLGASEADTRARNILAKAMGEGGWHFQTDVDEYFIDFAGLVSELKKTEHLYSNKKVTLEAYWSLIFKQTDKGFFVVNNPEKFALITNHPVYLHHRYNADNEHYTLDHLILHQSWGRGEEGLKKKLNNWAHRIDFDTASYFNFWKSVDTDNYKYIHDFHPIKPYLWRGLDYIPAQEIDELLARMPSKAQLPEERWPRLKKWFPPVIYNRLQKMA